MRVGLTRSNYSERYEAHSLVSINIPTMVGFFAVSQHETPYAT